MSDRLARKIHKFLQLFGLGDQLPVIGLAFIIGAGFIKIGLLIGGEPGIFMSWMAASITAGCLLVCFGIVVFRAVRNL